MSWAAHNPEKYDEICREGMVEFLKKRIPELEGQEDNLDYLLSELKDDIGDVSEAYEKLLLAANEEISAAEGDHFAGIADAGADRDK